ncbi:chloramphenicol acetyltransferase [Chryseobacterium culicis]|uniref:Chloramphenicol O-acetyltransferase type A n=1 Tax=Chryseobacterium culicis TaxID=680127 RepID=A0A1H6HAQ2_CHRCI|nr:chloramphenicol acetyltransferase [Chryseobacterium culicis]MBE4948827.1 chloramphenicol acetyltransferase [Chryseobacterium culicis]SEH32887.1 chloramphenicol O-acetyltransferase type A [Chryseobacterium culicis]
MKIVDIDRWNRKEHFEFFSQMASPYFGLTTEVDCTQAYDMAKKKGYSFFAYYYHKSMVAINTVEELKLRIIDGQVIQFDTVHAGSTIGRPDGTFGFSFTHFSEDFETFNAGLQEEIKGVHATTGLRLSNERLGKDHVRHTTIPWNSFSAIVHPTDFNTAESVPKIAFGRFNLKDGRKYLPVSIEAHHGLADGIHIAQYLKEFQRQLDLD